MRWVTEVSTKRDFHKFCERIESSGRVHAGVTDAAGRPAVFLHGVIVGADQAKGEHLLQGSSGFCNDAAWHTDK